MNRLDTRLMRALAAGLAFMAISVTIIFAQTKQLPRVDAAIKAAVSTDRKAMLGVSVSVPANEDGLTVEFVLLESPAATAGIQVGDILLQFDDQLLFHPLQLQKLVERSGVGSEVEVTYLRGKERAACKCRLMAATTKPVDPAMAFGVSDEAIKKALRDAGIPDANVGNLNFVRIGEPGNAIVRLNRTDKGWAILIQDLNGKEIFSGPFNTDTDRAAIPEKYQSILPLLGEIAQ